MNLLHKVHFMLGLTARSWSIGWRGFTPPFYIYGRWSVYEEKSVYKNDLREDRKALFNALYHFTRMVDINYICPMINQGECAEKSKLAYTDKLTKEIANTLRVNYEFFFEYNMIIVYYDYGQIELAQILVSVFNTMFSNVQFRKIETNQYKLSQAADLICTVEAIAQKNVLTKSEIDFFHSKRDFKKNIYKNIVKKKL